MKPYESAGGIFVCAPGATCRAGNAYKPVIDRRGSNAERFSRIFLEVRLDKKE